MAEEQITLASVSADLKVPPICCGTWAWGDSTWDWEEKRDMPGVEEVWSVLRKNNIASLDTAEVYGMGESERIVGRLLKTLQPEERSKVFIASKWLPVPLLPNRLWPIGIVGSCKRSLERMGIPQMDLYQVHSSWTYFYSYKSVAKALAECVKTGLTKSVGVSNYSTDQMTQMHKLLAAEGIPLATNQVEYSLLRTLPETSGLLKAAKDLNVVLLAYSPLAQGRLTGKYSASNPPSSKRKFSNIPMDQVEPLLRVMRTIATQRDVPVSAVALNWVIVKGAIPLGGARNGKQAEQNAKAVGWRLTVDEVQKLDAHAHVGKYSMWQKG